MGLRRKGRELALQALYQQEVAGDVSGQALRLFWQHFESAGGVKDFAMGLVDGVIARRGEIDALIEKVTANGRLERVSKVDLNILRVATFELLATPEVPPAVVINEAIEIARRFGTEESSVFVNGVLDQIATELGVKPAETTAAPAADE